MAVRIGIPFPTTTDLPYNDQFWPDYARAVRDVGGEVVPIDPSKDFRQTRIAARECDGFVLPGSPADVNPGAYGQARASATADPDESRDTCDRALLEIAAESGRPVLAICYGLQQLNVWLGGTLVQDLAPLPVNHAAGAGVAVAHTVSVVSESLLAGLLTGTEAPSEAGVRRLPTNSSHHQAVAIPGDGLAVVARCVQDGVVEALEGRAGQASVLGVQWHPERSTAISPASRALFTWLVLEAEDQQTKRGLEGPIAHAL